MPKAEGACRCADQSSACGNRPGLNPAPAKSSRLRDSSCARFPASSIRPRAPRTPSSAQSTRSVSSRHNCSRTSRRSDVDAMQPPPEPKLYHIVHVDRLPSIVKDTCLWCDAQVRQRQRPGTRIGYRRIKRRRLNESTLHSSGTARGRLCAILFRPKACCTSYIVGLQNWNIRAGRTPSSTWKRICNGLPMRMSGAGPSRRQTPAQLSLKTLRALIYWAKSIGRQYIGEIGDRRCTGANRPSS